MLWPANSPDLNIIESAWFWMKRRTTRHGTAIRANEEGLAKSVERLATEEDSRMDREDARAYPEDNRTRRW
jgi:hypothetical protein